MIIFTDEHHLFWFLCSVNEMTTSKKLTFGYEWFTPQSHDFSITNIKHNTTLYHTHCSIKWSICCKVRIEQLKSICKDGLESRWVSAFSLLKFNVHARGWRIDPNINGIDTRMSIGIGSILAHWSIFCCTFSSISLAIHLYFFTEFVWSQHPSQSLCALLLSTSLTLHTQVHSEAWIWQNIITLLCICWRNISIPI